MNLYGKVVSVDLEAEIPYAPQSENAGKTYPGWELILRDSDNKIVPIQKHRNNLDRTPGLRASLEAIAPGDEITVVQEKKGQFNNVVKIVKGFLEGSAGAGELQPATGGRGKVLGNTYETPEERKTKQRLIVRQAAINQALEFAVDRKGVKIEDILEQAAKFEDWVYRGID